MGKKGYFIISVKNPYLPTKSRVDLEPRQKADYSEELKIKFENYRFIPLTPASYLNYEGAELLLIGKGTPDLSEKDPDVKKCIFHIPAEDLIERFKDIQEIKSLNPLFDKKWV